MAGSDETIKVSEKRALAGQVAPCLVVSADGIFAAYSLARGARLLIGRTTDCDVCIDLPSVSRRHAVITTEPRLEVTDLGSANGTFVDDVQLEPNRPCAITPGAIVAVGHALLRVEGAWSRQYGQPGAGSGLREQLRRECQRCARSGRGFGVAVIETSPGSAPDVLRAVFDRVIRAADRIGRASATVHELLVVDVDEPQLAAAVDRLRTELADAGVRAELGFAWFPRDGTSAEQLVATAWASLRRAGASRPPPGQGALAKVRRLIEQVAPSDMSIVLRGETGAGKEVFAEMVHRQSHRARGPFLKLNCAAFGEALLESELFGHERGAFTGADSAKPGLLETAGGGSVFLDEIGDLPLALQAKLLRVLEDRSVLRVGGLGPRPIDVRFISATNRPLERDIERGRFRQDLYYRLGGVTVSIPPLRERKDEIEGLALAFIAGACDTAHRSERPALAPATLDVLLGRDWPGNVRELRNAVERAVLLCGDGPIEPEHLPSPAIELSTSEATNAPAEPAAEPVVNRSPVGEATSLRDGVARLEKERIVAALEQCAGNQTRAARVLGISRSTLHLRMDAYEIPRPRKTRR